ETANDTVEGGLPTFVDAVCVVHLARAVDGDADQEVVLLEERSPGVVEQRAVALRGVEDSFTGPRRPSIDLDDAPKEDQAHSSRPATLPGDDDLRGFRVCLQELTDVGFLKVLGHAKPAARVEHLLGQEEAVFAVQVADGTCRLGHQVEGERSILAHEHVAPRYSRMSMATASRSRSA